MSIAVTLNPFLAKAIACLPEPHAISRIFEPPSRLTLFRIKPIVIPTHNRLLFNIARPIVASSANSRSPPIGKPLAILVTVTFNGFNNFAR